MKQKRDKRRYCVKLHIHAIERVTYSGTSTTSCVAKSSLGTKPTVQTRAAAALDTVDDVDAAASDDDDEDVNDADGVEDGVEALGEASPTMLDPRGAAEKSFSLA